LIDESVALEGCWVSHLGGATLLLRMQGQETTEESSAALEEVSMVIYLQMVTPKYSFPAKIATLISVRSITVF
jgi:hypothetical protein